MKTLFGTTFGRIWMTLLYFISVYIFKIRNKIKIEGKRPNKENAILYVSNHQTLIDSLLIGIGVSSFWDIFFKYRQIPYNAPDYMNFFKNPISRQIMYLSKCIPAHRKVSSFKMIDTDISRFCSLLEKKNNLLLFFAGTRMRDQEIGECKYGVAKTIQIAKPIVIPIFLKDISPIMPISSGFHFNKIYGGHRGKMVIGPEIKFSNLDDLEIIKKEVRDAILELDK